eukprot:5198181-Prymnesium_polylepis.1
MTLKPGHCLGPLATPLVMLRHFTSCTSMLDPRTPAPVHLNFTRNSSVFSVDVLSRTFGSDAAAMHTYLQSTEPQL